ncbi:MAG: sodium:solute symporter family transporter, partial [Candidatus Acidiferrales bacterium]
YGGKERFGEAVQVLTGRVFVIVLTVLAYVIALQAPETIFNLAVQYAFSGYAALVPLLIAALFWKGSTKWGALASTLWVAAAVAGVAIFQQVVAPPVGPPKVIWALGEMEILSRTASGTSVLGLMPVVPMTLLSALLLVVVSAFTRKPSPQTITRYFH